jgi:hypothetical protein
MGAELLERSVLRAFSPEMQIEIGEDGTVAVGIVDVPNVAVDVGNSKPVVGRLRGGNFRLEESANLPGHLAQLAGHHETDLDTFRRRLHRPNQDGATVRRWVRTEHRERIAMTTFGDSR